MNCVRCLQHLVSTLFIRYIQFEMGDIAISTYENDAMVIAAFANRINVYGIFPDTRRIFIIYLDLLSIFYLCVVCI